MNLSDWCATPYSGSVLKKWILGVPVRPTNPGSHPFRMLHQVRGFFMRKQLSKKTRFDIFKRDGFACQYCGATPPQVILHVDHIVAVAEGGGNESDNLISSCEPCNLGKGARSLSAIPVSLGDKAKLIAESEAQLRGYQEIMQCKQDRIKHEVWVIGELFTELNPGRELTETALNSVRTFIEKIGVHEVERALRIAYTNTRIVKDQRFRYFCGVCWKMARGD